MSKRGILILIILILGVGSVILWAVIPQKFVYDETPIEVSDNGFTPFGSNGDDTEDLTGNNNFVLTPGAGNTQTEIPGGISILGRLEKLVEMPVAGATIYTAQREIPSLDPVFDSEQLQTYSFTEYEGMIIGDDRPEVRLVKIVLNRQNPSPELNDTTLFDADLQSAVATFQESKNITPDGVIGNRTKEFLNSFQGIDSVADTAEYEEIETVRFVERESGYIFDIYTDTKENIQITKTLIPRVQEAFFGNNNSTVLLRYLNNMGSIVQTFKGDIIDQESGLSRVEGDFLANDIASVSVSPNKSKFFYLISKGENVSGVIQSFNSDSSSVVFESPFHEWLSQWIDSSSVMLTTKASAMAFGYAYDLNTNTEKYLKVMGNEKGFTTNVSPDGSKLIYSIYNEDDQTMSVNLYDLEEDIDIKLGLNTIPEKCAWYLDSQNILCGVPKLLVNADYPDDWYQGTILFNDDLWFVNTATGEINKFIDPEGEAGEIVDIIDPVINDSGTYLIFTNKHDLSLWGLDLPKFQ